MTDLYLDFCSPKVEERRCALCCRAVKHAVASRVATTPEVLVLAIDRDGETLMAPIDVEEELLLPQLAAMRLVAVVYRARGSDGGSLYSCACRGPMDAFWYFEEGRAPEAIRRSISHVKPKHVCMLFYERIVKRVRVSKRHGGVGPARDNRDVSAVARQLLWLIIKAARSRRCLACGHALVVF